MIRSMGIGLLGGLLAIGGMQAQPTHAPAEPVDINRATVSDLMQVPGMTASWAGRIVRFRPYRTKLDLVQLGVVTPEEYQRIREHVVAHRMTKSEQPPHR